MSRTFLPQTSSSTSQSYKTSLERQDTLDDSEIDLERSKLRSLSPRSSRSYAHTSRNASPSPPPSFYRDHVSSSRSPLRGENSQRYTDSENQDLSARGDYSPSPSRSRRKSGRHIMFAAPPPPIASSVFLQPQQNMRPLSSERVSSLDRPGTRGVDPLVIVERREKAIQRDLQALLDAQSDGLMQGFGGSMGESGDNTPTTRSVNGSSRRGSGSQGRSGIVPVRQPKIKPVGLRAARRGLLREMQRLAEVKIEERLLLEQEIERREQVLRKIGTWERRISTAKRQLSTPSTDSSDDTITTLESEQATIDKEIFELEDRLMLLKARRGNLTQRLTESINKRDARLSSYRGALREAEMEVKSFLTHPPISSSPILSSSTSETASEHQPFLTLPPSRRTLTLAQTWLTSEQRNLSTRKSSSEKEIHALEAGSHLWSKCIDILSSFEDELRSKMKSGKVIEESDLKGQIERMGGIIRELDGVQREAMKKGWNLLVMATAAEGEALRIGRGILRGVVGEKDEEEKENGEVGRNVGDGDAHGRGKDDDGDDRNLSGLDNVSRGGIGTGKEAADTAPGNLSTGTGTGRGTEDEVKDEEEEEGEEEEEEEEGPNLEELLIDRS